MAINGVCIRPDRSVPGILCGHSLPCRHHTLVLDKNEYGEAQVRIPASGIPHVSSKTLETLKDISRAIHEENHGN